MIPIRFIERVGVAILVAIPRLKTHPVPDLIKDAYAGIDAVIISIYAQRTFFTVVIMKV
jgi:hypothetical protein